MQPDAIIFDLNLCKNIYYCEGGYHHYRTVPFSLSPREKRTTHFLYHLSYCHIGNKIDGTVQSSINVCNSRYKTEQMRICLVVQYRNEKN